MNRLDHPFYGFVRYIFRLIICKSSPCCLTLNTHFMSLFSGIWPESGHKCWLDPPGVLPYKGLMGTCGQPGYVFRNFCLKQGIDFINICLKQGTFSWTINSLRVRSTNVLNRVWKSEFCPKQGRKISDFCLTQGQGIRGRAAPPHPKIYRVPPPGLRPNTPWDNKEDPLD